MKDFYIQVMEASPANARLDRLSTPQPPQLTRPLLPLMTFNLLVTVRS
jgi:hypothetical protein